MQIACVFAIFAALPALNQGVDTPRSPDEPTSEVGVRVYKQVLPSTVWVHSDRGAGKLATGSGSLIDKGRRLVLTNYHVVGDVKRTTVFFPAFDDKKIVPERKFYLERATKLGIAGEVVEVDKTADLALIRLDRLPEDAVELPLAAGSPDPGQTVHSIGNPGKSGALWVYTPGKVRQVYSKTWKAKLDEKTVLTFQSKVVETDSPTNPGDSGGPLVNDKGELVGVTEGGATDAQSLSLFIDVSEVKKLMTRRSVIALRAAAEPKPKEPVKPHREKPLESKDAAKLFKAEAWKQFQAASERLLKESATDFVIDTIEAPPTMAEAVRKMTFDEKEKYFHGLVNERAKADKVQGAYIVICKSPSHLYVGTTGDMHFPSADASKIRAALLASLREKKPDDGLAKVVKIALEAKGLGEK
jgi:V8-like Glu-specific endopeptidase